MEYSLRFIPVLVMALGLLTNMDVRFFKGNME
jgi:hypothetical protein